MITKNDILLLLSDLENKGIKVEKSIYSDLLKNGVTLDVLKFINDNRQLDLYKFYEKIRKSYNQKHSNLYINIVKEIEDVNKVLVTLSALQTQILLFSEKDVDDREMFLRHARIAEISKVLFNYYQTYDLKPCIKLLKLFKADIKCLQETTKQ